MEALETPCVTFFTMLREGRKLKKSENSYFIHELFNVALAAYSGDIEFVKTMKEFYSKDIFGESKKQGKVFDSDSPEEMNKAGAILLDIARQKMRLHGLLKH